MKVASRRFLGRDHCLVGDTVHAEKPRKIAICGMERNLTPLPVPAGDSVVRRPDVLVGTDRQGRQGDHKDHRGSADRRPSSDPVAQR